MKNDDDLIHMLFVMLVVAISAFVTYHTFNAIGLAMGLK